MKAGSDKKETSTGNSMNTEQDNNSSAGYTMNLAATLLLMFTVFVFAPFEIYLSNKNYFFFDGTDMIAFSLLLFAAGSISLVIGSFILDRLMHGNAIRVISVLIWMFALALYVQGNFVRADYGIMDGTPIDWSMFKVEGVISILVFAVIIAGCVVLYIKASAVVVSKTVIYSSVCIIVLQIFTLTVLMTGNNGLRRPMEYVSTTNEEFNLSKDENFIILMLDTFDSQAFDEILKDADADRYRDILEGFTYYPDTLADYSYTDLAFPAILSGEKYLNDEPYGDYLNKVYDRSPLLNRLEADDWYCGIYTTSLFADSDDSLKIDNCLRIRRTVSSHRRLAGFMYRLVGFRYVIQPLKQYFWFYPDDMESELSDTGVDGVYTFGFNNFIFYDGIDGMHTDMDKKSFHWYHLDGTHPPFDITPEFYDNGANNWSEDGIYDEARGMMVLVDKFTGKLKELGVYDNSTIVIMADHGYLQKRQSPLFMIKGRGQTHPFEIKEDVQLSFSDLQGIWENILDGETSAGSIVDIEPGDRERVYRYYKWNVDLGYDSYARDLTEYVVTGDCRDMGNVVEDGMVYSHGVK